MKPEHVQWLGWGLTAPQSGSELPRSNVALTGAAVHPMVRRAMKYVPGDFEVALGAALLPEDRRPEVQKFIADYKARYGKTPDAMAVLGYDAMKMMADAIRRAGSTDGAKIRDALAATHDFPGVSGRISMDPDRNARKAMVIVQIRDGQFRFVESIAPDA